MNLTIDYDNAWEVALTLVQLLPFEESIKYELLGMTDVGRWWQSWICAEPDLG